MPQTHNRRSFVTTLASVAGLTALGGTAAAAQAPARGTTAAAPWDLSWFDAFKGAHKQMYDYGTFELADDTRPLRFVKNYLDTYRDVFGLQAPDINTAVGISRSGFPMNVSDAVWQKYKIGERWKIADPATKQPAVRNIFLSDGDLSVKALQARGTAFWQCNVALGAISQQLAQAAGVPAAEVRADLVAGLNPGVHIVPAHVMAIGIAQEHGFTYMKT
jgi:intracellular sulfur oxidation DsrE/DsrF family protein